MNIDASVEKEAVSSNSICLLISSSFSVSESICPFLSASIIAFLLLYSSLASWFIPRSSCIYNSNSSKFILLLLLRERLPQIELLNLVPIMAQASSLVFVKISVFIDSNSRLQSAAASSSSAFLSDTKASFPFLDSKKWTYPFFFCKSTKSLGKRFL